MPYKEKDHLTKKYWFIGEIADELGIETSAIRFWCNELNIKVNRGKADIRKFTASQRETIHLLHRLIHLRGHTVRSAKEMIDNRQDTLNAIYTLIITRRDDHAAEEILNLFY